MNSNPASLRVCGPPVAPLDPVELLLLDDAGVDVAAGVAVPVGVSVAVDEVVDIGSESAVAVGVDVVVGAASPPPHPPIRSRANPRSKNQIKACCIRWNYTNGG